ncbi:MAG: hypothetical protein KC420_17310, partial [Myxococcales bacterium]|nr:hypothetical protein [Myxococcales bacterium]
ALLAAVFAVSGAALVRLPDLGELLWGAADNRLGYRNLGLWARDRFEDGAVIGGLQSGALAYYAPRLEIVNLDGVVNEDAYWALRRRRLLDYIRAREVRYLIGWKDNIWMMANQSRGFSSNDWVHRRRIKGFRSWGFEWQLYEVLYPGREDMAKRPGWKKRARPPAEAAAAAP